jgi:C4-dicarboxylate transporter, DctQ subunit
MRLLNRLGLIFDRIIDVMAILAGVLLVLITLTVVAGVIARGALARPLGWIIEVSEYVLVYITFLITAWVLRQEGHVKLELVLSKLNPSVQRIMNFCTSVVGAMVCFTLTWFGITFTWDLFQSNYFTPGTLMLPKYIFAAIIPIGSFTLFVQFLRRAYRNLLSLKEPGAKGQTPGKSTDTQAWE